MSVQGRTLCTTFLYPSHLNEPDEVGEDEEGRLVLHPLQEAKEYKGPAIDEKAGRENGANTPDRQVLANQGPCNAASTYCIKDYATVQAKVQTMFISHNKNKVST